MIPIKRAYDYVCKSRWHYSVDTTATTWLALQNIIRKWAELALASKGTFASISVCSRMQCHQVLQLPQLTSKDNVKTLQTRGIEFKILLIHLHRILRNIVETQRTYIPLMLSSSSSACCWQHHHITAHQTYQIHM